MTRSVDIHFELVERSRKGDRKAQKALFELYSKAMFNTGIRLLGNKEDAADVTQDTFIIAFTKLDQFKGDSTFGAWLKRIMINKCLNFLERKKVYFDIMTDPVEEIEENAWDIKEMMAELMVSLNELPEGARVVFTLYYFEGYDHEEIASILKLNVSTSKSQLVRARLLLKNSMIQKIEA